MLLSETSKSMLKKDVRGMISCLGIQSRMMSRTEEIKNNK